jgi:hypothetical protein
MNVAKCSSDKSTIPFCVKDMSLQFGVRKLFRRFFIHTLQVFIKYIFVCNTVYLDRLLYSTKIRILYDILLSAVSMIDYKDAN